MKRNTRKQNLSKDYLNSLSEEELAKELQSWTPEEQVLYLCPNGTMPIEEFRKYAYEITED